MKRDLAVPTAPWRLLIAVGLAMFGLGCSPEPQDTELLLVYSGDCKGYIEPCG